MDTVFRSLKLPSAAVRGALGAVTITLLVGGIVGHEPRFFLLSGALVILAQFTFELPGALAMAGFLSMMALIAGALAGDIPERPGLLAMPVYFGMLCWVLWLLRERHTGEILRVTIDEEANGKEVAGLEERINEERSRIAGGRQRIEKIFNLTRVSSRLSAGLSLQDVASQVLRGTDELTSQPGTSTLSLFESEGTMVFRLDATGRVVQAREDPDPFSQWVRVRLMPLYVQDLSKELRFRDAAGAVPARGSVIATPLVRGQAAIGALMAISRPGEKPFTQEDWRLLSIMGDLSSVAIQNAQLFRRTQEEAITDGLTGVFVHRHFQERLMEEVRRSGETGKPLTMIMADIDNFKNLNDTHGHPVGDVVLRGVARVFSDGSRGSDFVARYGGEEFAILLVETDAEGGMLVAERLRAGVENLSFTEAGVARPVTVSMGVATITGKGGDGRTLVERADEALYSAKAQGKNRVVLAGSM